MFLANKFAFVVESQEINRPVRIVLRETFNQRFFGIVVERRSNQNIFRELLADGRDNFPISYPEGAAIQLADLFAKFRVVLVIIFFHDGKFVGFICKVGKKIRAARVCTFGNCGAQIIPCRVDKSNLPRRQIRLLKKVSALVRVKKDYRHAATVEHFGREFRHAPRVAQSQIATAVRHFEFATVTARTRH